MATLRNSAPTTSLACSIELDRWDRIGWLRYCASIKMLQRTILETTGTFSSSDVGQLFDKLGRVVEGDQGAMVFSPVAPCFKIEIRMVEGSTLFAEDDAPEPVQRSEEEPFDVVVMIDLEKAAGSSGAYVGEGPAVRFVVRRSQLRAFLDDLRAEHVACEPPLEG